MTEQKIEEIDRQCENYKAKQLGPRVSPGLFNARPLVILAFFVFCTVIVMLWSNNVGIWIVFVWFGVLVGFFILVRHFCRDNGDNVLKFIARSKILFICAMVICTVVALSFTFTNLYYSNLPGFNHSGELTGIVRSHNINEEGSGNFVLGNATFGGESVRGRVRVHATYLTPESTRHIQSGDIVTLRTTGLRAANNNTFNINNRITYTTQVTRVNIHTEGGSTDLRSSVHRYVDNYLHRWMSPDSANLIFAMVFGDRSLLDDEVRSNFGLIGLAHVLAVSGMHVGLVVAVILFGLRALRMPKGYQLLILIVFLGFYMYLCDFRVSIMRASIMFLIFATTRLFVRRADILSSLSLAFIITLIIFPYSMLSASFQLSYGCILGIALFYRPVSGFLERRLRLRGVARDCATLCITTDITTFPLLLLYFGLYPFGISAVANIILLPIVLLAFQMSIIAIITVIGYPLLFLVDYMVWFILWLSNGLAQINLLRVQLDGGGAWFLVYILGLIILSRYVFLRRRTKLILASACFSVYLVSLLIINLM